MRECVLRKRVRGGRVSEAEKINELANEKRDSLKRKKVESVYFFLSRKRKRLE